MRGLRLGLLTCGISLLAMAPALAQETYYTGAYSPHATVAKAETNLNISVGFMHTQYSEGPLDAENGFTPGFGVGASVLLPSAWQNIDYYAAFAYQFNAGNLTYNGHYLVSGEPVTATDRAVFNRIQARMGLGFPVANGALEIIPYFTAGYMSWNRNVDNKGQIGTDEFYSSALVGGGLKLDIPVTATVVVSGGAEFLGMVGNHLMADGLGIGWGLGNSAQQRVSLGVDDALYGPWHLQASANWTHFNYAGSKPSYATYGYYEPLSTTTQVGMNLGVAYSF
jgi:hypothetical protein